MSGGSEEATRGILETSPGAIAVLIVFFLLATLGFERGLHTLKHHLQRRKKLGLLAAVNNLTNELMLLAVASLMLTALEPAITKVCMPSHNAMQPWLSNVNACACCLAKTHGVTPCFLESRQCPAELSEQCGVPKGPHRPFRSRSNTVKYATPDNSTEQGADTAAARAPEAAGMLQPAGALHRSNTSASSGGLAGRRLSAATTNGTGATAEAAADEPICVGAYQEWYAECNYEPGYAPAVTGETLEQVHMLLFIMAVVHITISMVVLLLSTFKLRVWRRIGGGPAEDALAAAALAAAAAAPSILSAKPQQQQQQPITSSAAHDSTVAADGRISNQQHAVGPQLSSAAPTHKKAAAAAAAATVAVEPASTARTPSAAVLVVAPSVAMGPAAALKASNWRGRPEQLKGLVCWFKELAELVLRQLVLLHPTLTRQEYSVLRASFYLTYLNSAPEKMTNAPPPPAAATETDSPRQHSAAEHQHQTAAYPAATAAAVGAALQGVYEPYLLENVERDGSKVVGLGLPMWILVLCFVLLSGAIGWATWLFLILAGGLLLGINTILLTTARYMTRGGGVKAYEPGTSRWLVLHNGKWLLAAIKLLLFFLSFVISNSVYFAAFFGPESCFFSRTGFQKNPIPWWGVMLVDLYLLLSLGLVTLPLYTVITHTLTADSRLLQDVQQRLQGGPEQKHYAHAHADSEWE